MICPKCVHYLPPGARPVRIAAACGWRPSDAELALLRSILPSPALSRALVQPSPHEVEACGAFWDGREAPPQPEPAPEPAPEESSAAEVAEIEQ